MRERSTVSQEWVAPVCVINTEEAELRESSGCGRGVVKVG